MAARPTKSPAFQFYPSNFLGSPKVRAMNAEQIGLYMLCLCLDWENDGFTLEEARELAETAAVTPEQFDADWTRVSRCFTDYAGRYRNGRLDEERAKQREWRRKSSKGGKLSAQRRLKGGSRVVQPPLENGSSGRLNTPSLSPSPTPVTTTTGRDVVFDEAWAVYPKRPGNSRADTLKQWHARVKAGHDPLDMLAGARAYAKYIEANPPEKRTLIKMAQTFFGPGEHFKADWTPDVPSDPLSARIAQVQAEEEAALEKTRQLLAARGAA